MTKDNIRDTIGVHLDFIHHYDELIKKNQDAIKDLQDVCPHDDGLEPCHSEWAPGHLIKGKYCVICNKFFPDSLPESTLTFTDFASYTT